MLDAGAFVAALEYGAGVKAVCVGKPEAAFFELALAELGLPPNAVVVVGDDPVNDVAAGGDAGCRTVLVRVGNGSRGYDASSAADRVLGSVADLREILG